MTRDWPIDWVESFELEKEKGHLQLKIKDRSTITLVPGSLKEAQAILHCFQDKLNQQMQSQLLKRKSVHE